MHARSILLPLTPYRVLKDIYPYRPASVTVTDTPAQHRADPAVFPVSPVGSADVVMLPLQAPQRQSLSSRANKTVLFFLIRKSFPG